MHFLKCNFPTAIMLHECSKLYSIFKIGSKITLFLVGAIAHCQVGTSFHSDKGSSINHVDS